VYVGSADYTFYAFNPDGSLKWSYTTGGNVWSSPAISADGTVYVGSADHKLYAFGP
jgi:outer membrane protein assembly factor BamB